MSDSRGPPALSSIGVLISDVMSARVASLVDEYGGLCDEPGGDDARRESLAILLVAILRCLRVEVVYGERFLLTRVGTELRLARRDAGRDIIGLPGAGRRRGPCV